MPNSRFALHGKRPSLIHGLCAFFASNSRFMRLFQAALDTCHDSPFFASLSVHARFALHGLSALEKGEIRVFHLHALPNKRRFLKCQFSSLSFLNEFRHFLG